MALTHRSAGHHVAIFEVPLLTGAPAPTQQCVEVQAVDDVERPLEAGDLRDFHCTVERDDPSGRDRHQLVVEREDLHPVGIGCGGGVGAPR